MGTSQPRGQGKRFQAEEIAYVQAVSWEENVPYKVSEGKYGCDVVVVEKSVTG